MLELVRAIIGVVSDALRLGVSFLRAGSVIRAEIWSFADNSRGISSVVSNHDAWIA
jgi:hypothetical protein